MTLQNVERVKEGEYLYKPLYLHLLLGSYLKSDVKWLTIMQISVGNMNEEICRLGRNSSNLPNYLKNSPCRKSSPSLTHDVGQHAA